MLAVPGAHYADVGYEYVDGAPTDRLAIRVHVQEKRPESELADEETLPQEIEGFPVDVIQSAPELQQSPRDTRFDPLIGGIAVRNPRFGFFGTLGLVVFDADNGTRLGLSNHHVLVAETGRKGDDIIQPANGVVAGDLIGTLDRWDETLDCAVCILNGSRASSTGIFDYPGGATGMAAPVIGTPVTKSGRTTQTTFGIIDGVSFTDFTIVPDPARPAVNGEISSGGDSGSIWLRRSDSAAVGLHFAGESDPRPAAERAWAKHMTAVAASLRITLVSTSGPVED
ncbi:hypothetical protein Ssi02_57380 [Sinosporangium siamense]|uniref:Trypsin-like peptidase domain-containing protein n=1 Tax=Sinosporangium siamense TaxID=1367973 RepID=A0A919VAK3_9ACTN|nr:hypothetical protein Ssi02_57380 [Sinosporangium siamense]